MLFTLFYSFGGLDLYLGLTTPFAPKKVDAAYTGKQLRTIEYLLAGGSEGVARASGVLSYFGSATGTTKVASGRESVVIAGSGIRVANAYLDVSFIASSSANMTALDVFFDAQYSALGGADVRVSEVASNVIMGSNIAQRSGYMRGTHDVTSFFATTSDAQWNAGIGVVAAASSTFSDVNARRILTTIKLVITYEEDFSPAGHSEVKTVRFPLSSTNGSDTGTRTAVCAAATTCSFTYTANIPDAAADPDILDVHFEMHAEVSSGASSTIQIGIRGGTASSSAFNWVENSLDDATVDVMWQPPVAAPNFQRSIAQTLDVLAGTVPLNLLGGEVVVTYRYLTNAAAQTETVRYFVNQNTTNPAIATSTFATTTTTISNTGLSVKNIWYRVHTAPIAAASLVIGGEVGSATKKFQVYTISATNPRAGDTPTIIHNMSADAASFSGPSTAIGGESRATVSNAPVGVEVYVTFTWDGNTAATVTKTVSYSAAQQGVSAVANVWNNRSAYVDLPELVTKTYRSAYLFTNYLHSLAGANITIGTVAIGVNGSTTKITENGDTKSFNARYLTKIASSTFSGGDTIAWRTRALEIEETKNVSNSAYFGNEVIVTYDAALGENGTTLPPKQLKTVEYELGGSTENIPQASGVRSYFGSATGTVKATASTRSVVIPGSDIRVVNAYLDVGFMASTTGNLTNLDVTIDVANTSSAGTDATTTEAVGTNIYASTGLTGYVRGNHDVTAFFDRQTDAQWASGVGVVASASSTFSVATDRRVFTVVKLVITYESTYTLVPHTEVKTVRFPLASTAGGDMGSRQAACAAASTCTFIATSTLPDLSVNADILDSYIEFHAEANSAVASTLQMGIRGGTASSSSFNWREISTDDNTVNVMWSPPVGSPDLATGTPQKIDILTGSVGLNALGGELVITYRYSTGATAQTETVRFFENQATTTPGITRNNFATITPTISNGALSVKNVWYKVHTAPAAGTNITIFGRVGSSTEKSSVYVIAGTNPRAGDTPTIIFNMSPDASFVGATTTLAGASQYSVVGAQAVVGVEAYVTFTWDGSLGGTTTRSVLFSGAQQGVSNNLNTWHNRGVRVELPETVTKTYRSAYIEANHVHSNAAGTIQLASTTIAVGGASTTIAEYGDTEAFNALYFVSIASSTFSSGDPITWSKRSLEIGQMATSANYSYFSNTVVVTYDAAQELKVPTFTQSHFHLYVNNDALLPTTAWPASGGGTLGEDTGMTMADSPLRSGSSTRIRMSFTVATTTLTAGGGQFRLQYAPKVTTCGAVSSWFAIGAPGSGTIWRGVAATPVDGTALSGNPPTGGDLLLALSDRAGTYEEANDTAVNPFAVAVTEDIEYDWNIENNSAATSTIYCFRMVKNNDAPFWSYTYYPEVATEGYDARTDTWRWYSDATNETPTTALAATNTAPINIANPSTIKLRINVRETNGQNGVAQKFKVQYSTYSDFSAGVSDAAATSSCLVTSGWCYGDGVDNDNDAISTRLLKGSTTANGTHNEGTSTTTFGPLASTATEFEYTLKRSGGASNMTYYFRLYDLNHSRPVPLYSGASYPSLSTDGTNLTVVVSGIATSTVTEGVTTSVGTDPTTIPLGTIAINASSTAAHRIDVTTNATEGYQVLLKANGSLLSNNGAMIPDVTGTNASPSAWGVGCTAGMTGCWGYHSGDDTLSGGSTRFLINDTFAQFATTTSQEVIYNSGPVTNEVTDIIYRVEMHQLQAAGSYSAQLQYIVVPIF